MKIAVITLAVAVAIARPFLPPHPVSMQGSYEALAHLLVGGVFGAWLASSQILVAVHRNWHYCGRNHLCGSFVRQVIIRRDEFRLSVA